VQRVRAFNEWLAAHATVVFGSMWMTYAFFLYGFVPVLLPHAMTVALYISNTVQLWSLPLLMVGSNVLGRAAERRALETHDTVMEELALLRAEHAATAAKTAELHALQVDGHLPDRIVHPDGPA
jgi:hypothetical protein